MEIILFWIGLAIIVGVAADRRGRSGFGWFFLAVALSPIIAGLLLLAMGAPQTTGGANIKTLHAPEAHVQRVKICPDCAEEVLADARICKHCRYDFAANSRPSRFS